MQQTYQDLELNTMQQLLPMERQMLLARIYHYAWYSNEAFDELNQFINKWESKCEVKAVFFNPQTNNNESTN